MKNFLFITFSLLLSFKSFAQENWISVYPNQKVYFEDIYKTVYCLRIDSTFNENTVLYPFSDLHQIDFECYTINSGSWLSKYIMINEEGNTIFVNGKNQQILIKNKAELNEVWEMFANESIKVKGKIISVSLKSVLGVSDSVKTISLSVFNNNDEPVNHTLNQFSIEISKHFGLVKTVNFYYFEHTTDSYELVYYKKGEIEWGTPYNLSVPENKKEQIFSIYPNPTTGELTIDNEQLTINN